MTNTPTSNFGYNKPSLGSRGWGVPTLNDNLDAIDADFAAEHRSGSGNDGKHGPKVTIAQTGNDNALVVTKTNTGNVDVIIVANSGSGWDVKGTTGVWGATKDGILVCMGITGPNLIGATGAQGITGLQGQTGLAGTNGSAGSQGNTGVQGASGIEGLQGIQGSKGNTGVQGITGLQGATGPGSLQAAYDGGQTITQSTAITITQTTAANSLVLSKTQTGAGNCIDITNSGTGYGLKIAHNGTGTGTAIRIDTDSTGYVGVDVFGKFCHRATMTANGGYGLTIGQTVNTIEPNSGYGLLYVNKIGTGASPAMVVNNSGTGSGINITSLGVALNVTQTGALNAINVIHSSTGKLVYFSKTPVNADMQIQFNRNDGSGDPDMYLTYWGQSDYNTLALTAGSGAGLHVNTSGNVIVSNLAASRFDGTARLAVMDGNVGIGQTNPTALLHVYSTASACGLKVNQYGDHNAAELNKGSTDGSTAVVVNISTGSGVGLGVYNSGSGIALRVEQYTANKGLLVVKTNTGAGSCIQSDNSGTGSGIKVNQIGDGIALEINQTNTAATANAISIVNSGSGNSIIITQTNTATPALTIGGGANTVRMATARTVTNSTDSGTTGDICWDASYIYVCTTTNTWKRATLASW